MPTVDAMLTEIGEIEAKRVALEKRKNELIEAARKRLADQTAKLKSLTGDAVAPSPRPVDGKPK